MTHNEKVLLIAALLLAHGSAVNAVPVVLTTSSLSATAATATFASGFSQPNAYGSYYFAFDTPIDDASALTSISAGSLSGGEAGTFTLSVKFVDGSSASLFSSSYTGFNPYTISFSGQSFQSFSTGSIRGLTFNIQDQSGGGGQPTLAMPAGSVLTFAVTPAVPEPSSVLLMLAGGAAGLLSLHRRRKSAAPQLATSE
jgi:hypothetical protein